MQDEDSIRDLYNNLISSWNKNDAAGFAVNFALDGQCIGFDGSEYRGARETEEQLAAIFKDHTVATYVSKIRSVRFVVPDVAVLSAIASMVPPGKKELNPERNVVQSLVAVRSSAAWRIALFQNTPAKYDGRPEAVDAFLKELRAV